MAKEGNGKYIFFALLAAVAILSALVVLPFITSIVAGLILAYVFYPFYNWMTKRLHKNVAAFATAVIIILLVTVPSVILINHLTQETHYIYLRTKQQLMSGEFIADRCYEDNPLCNSVRNFNELFQDENIKAYTVNMLNDVLTAFTKRISGLIFSLPRILLHLFIMLFTTFYALKDGKHLVERLTKIFPLTVHHQDEIVTQLSDVTKAVIYGSFIVALVQGALGAFGFWVFGISGFLWWGVLITLFAFIPFIGTSIIWLPASAYLTLSGYLQGETGLMWRGLGLFIYCLIIVSTVDNILKPFVVAGQTKVHPLLILVGILGGLFFFGIIGVLIGPLTLALLQTLLRIYERERVHHPVKTTILGHTK